MLKSIWNWIVGHDSLVVSSVLALLFTRYAAGIMFKLFLFAFVAYTFYYVVPLAWGHV